MYKPKVTILLLAAGGSSRLGQPKQVLPWKSSNLLQNAIEVAKETKACRVVLVLGANYNTIISKINTSDIEVFHNKTWYRGIGNSIAEGVKQSLKTIPETDAILVMLSDQPLIESKYLNRLISKFQHNKQQIIATNYANNNLGVPAIFEKNYFNELMLLKGDNGAKQIIKDYLAKVISEPVPLESDDIDTMQDYKSLYKANHQ